MSRRYVPVIVVAVLLLLCAGILFPGVCRVREAAARMTCTSHLKQWAVALHNYADTFPESRNGKPRYAFPAGTIPNADLPPEERLSWYVSVLPYVEQSDLYKQFDLRRGPSDSRNQPATEKGFSHLVCPSSGAWERDARRWRSSPRTDYVGVSGVGPDAAMLSLGHPRAGVFGYDRRTAFPDDMPDGMSNTLLLIETANNPGHWANGGTATVRAFEPGTAPYIGPGQPFGGFHNGAPAIIGTRTYTCNVAMADGSVRGFSNVTAPEVLEALATVNGKETLPANW